MINEPKRGVPIPLTTTTDRIFHVTHRQGIPAPPPPEALWLKVLGESHRYIIVVDNREGKDTAAAKIRGRYQDRDLQVGAGDIAIVYGLESANFSMRGYIHILCASKDVRFSVVDLGVV